MRQTWSILIPLLCAKRVRDCDMQSRYLTSGDVAVKAFTTCETQPNLWRPVAPTFELIMTTRGPAPSATHWLIWYRVTVNPARNGYYGKEKRGTSFNFTFRFSDLNQWSSCTKLYFSPVGLSSLKAFVFNSLHEMLLWSFLFYDLFPT